MVGKVYLMADLKTMLAIPSALAIVVGGLFAANNYVAKASQLQLVAQRLDQKIRSDNVSNTQDRVWDLEKENRGRQECDWPVDDLYRYKKAKAKLKCLEDGRDDCESF